jgi:hypothetical protein
MGGAAALSAMRYFGVTPAATVMDGSADPSTAAGAATEDDDYGYE